MFATCTARSLLLALTIGSVIQIAAARADVCHDGIWGPTEYCGRDCYLSTGGGNVGFTDMNHDCQIDALDFALFAREYNATGPALSGDFRSTTGGAAADGMISAADYAYFVTKLDMLVSPCTSVPVPSVCEGTIALSFSLATISDNISQAPGTYTAYVWIDDVVDALMIEYGIKTSSNITINYHQTLLPDNYLTAPGCISAFSTGFMLARTHPLLSIPLGPVVAIEYQLLDSNPAWMTIAPAACNFSGVRWTTEDASLSHNFAELYHAGINGPTPSPNGCPGTISGTVYADAEDDCSFNGADFPVAGRVVQAAPGVSRVTDLAGYYEFTLPSGAYTVTMAPGVNDPWKLRSCQVSSYAVNVTGAGASTGNDFALKPVGNVTGKVYRDFGGDCVFNAGMDAPIANRMIEVNPGGYIGYSNASGDYSITVPIGAYSVSQVAVVGDTWALQACQATATYPVVVTTNGTVSGNDFALELPGDPQCDVSVNVYSNGVVANQPACPSGHPYFTPCPGYESEYVVVVKADPLSTIEVPAGAELDIALDPAFTIATVTSNFSFTALGSSGPNQRTVQLDDPLYPGHQWAVTVRGTPSSGSQFVTQATFDDFGTCTGVKTASITETTLCSCDPNDLTVVPVGCGPDGEIAGDTRLTYKIRFENIGSGAAHNIFIEDVLDSDLDLSTFTVVKTSHPLTGIQIDPGNTLVMSFDGIELPGTSGPGSNRGYVVFSIDPKPNLTDGTTILNTAEIVFDYNEPVVTNTTLNTVKTVPLTCSDICHDNVWGYGEFCGYDAFVQTGVPDMNHDCIVDALDVGLFSLQDPGLPFDPYQSADLDGDNSIDADDFNILIGAYGQTVPGCTSTALPDTCAGTIALSFFEYPDFVVDNVTQSPGTYLAFVVVKDAPDARIVSYSISTSANVNILSHTASGGTVAYACDTDRARIIELNGPLTSAPVFVGVIQYNLTDSNPASMVITPLLAGACDDKIRWTTSSADRSYNFRHVTNAGINGPTPAPSNTCTATGVNPVAMPRTDQLGQNRPNPFNPTTTIEYALSSQKRVNISIYSIRGALVRRLVDETQPAGWHRTEWNGRNESGSPVASGVYVYRMQAGSFVETKKLVLLK